MIITFKCICHRIRLYNYAVHKLCKKCGVVLTAEGYIASDDVT
jgi:hypothetical protein